ncbi:hypothetical protein XCR1_3090003 [Xenorhabdus cabanillasii JM26]|uniref:Uncharacterized protein n=1 Tax=Xenorhabdus cabanillasii JM26 TaxID=1427517 RepID=W1J920_9GAMM|nr:hypothetical protein XCR1_3090003 [Xenorhabdus cabanillasii JM26]
MYSPEKSRNAVELLFLILKYSINRYVGVSIMQLYTHSLFPPGTYQ